MTKRSLFQPDLVLGSTILRLTPELLAPYQLKGLVLDVDDTLVPFYATEIAPELQEWVKTIRKKWAVSLVSNNLSEHRIRRIADALELPYLFGAGKPSRRKILPVLEAMGLKAHEVAMVGDRLITDILVGNRLGMFTILVEPISHPGVISPTMGLRELEILVSPWLGVSLPERNIT